MTNEETCTIHPARPADFNSIMAGGKPLCLDCAKAETVAYGNFMQAVHNG